MQGRRKTSVEDNKTVKDHFCFEFLHIGFKQKPPLVERITLCVEQSPR